MVHGANGLVGLPVHILVVVGYATDNEPVIVHLPPMMVWIVEEIQPINRAVIPMFALVIKRCKYN